MDYMSDKEIRKYKIETDNLDTEVDALGGYYYWHCPRCKKVLDTVDGKMTRKCLHCRQSVRYK
jgi:hypothetical protein